MKEAKLIEKCENLQEKMRQFSKLQSTISEQSSHIRVLQVNDFLSSLLVCTSTFI